MTRRRWRAPALVLLLVVGACGGNKTTTPDAHDASASTDTGAASNDTGAAAYDGSVPAPGTATLTGPQAFPVGSALMVASSAGPCGGSSTGSPGVIAQVAVLLTSQGLPSLLCTDAGEPDAGDGSWIDIEIATTQAAVGDEELTQSLAPGTYVIGNEGEDDPDLCMLPNGSNAFLQILTPTGYDAQAIAISGTVTIESISEGGIAGTFSVLMGGPYGYTDASPPPSLSGAFNATGCP